LLSPSGSIDVVQGETFIAPTVSLSPSTAITIEAEQTLPLLATGYDEDGDPLSYTVESTNNTVATVMGEGPDYIITALAEGESTLTVTASDGTATAEATLAISVEPKIAQALPDTDMDGVSDVEDNCPLSYNVVNRRRQ